MQRIFLEGGKLGNRHTQSHHCQVCISGEDVRERVSYEMVLRSRTLEWFKTSKVREVHTAADGEFNFIRGPDGLDYRRMETVRTDHDPTACAANPLVVVPSDSCDSAIKANHVCHTCPLEDSDAGFLSGSLEKNPVQRDSPFAKEEAEVLFRCINRFR